MLSTYLNAFVRHGLAVEELVEPPPPDNWQATASGAGLVPVYLVGRCRRNG
jgi:hypothetical protein